MMPLSCNDYKNGIRLEISGCILALSAEGNNDTEPLPSAGATPVVCRNLPGLAQLAERIKNADWRFRRKHE
jgi:hypothetical protein